MDISVHRVRHHGAPDLGRCGGSRLLGIKDAAILAGNDGLPLPGPDAVLLHLVNAAIGGLCRLAPENPETLLVLRLDRGVDNSQVAAAIIKPVPVLVISLPDVTQAESCNLPVHGHRVSRFARHVVHLPAMASHAVGLVDARRRCPAALRADGRGRRVGRPHGIPLRVQVPPVAAQFREIGSVNNCEGDDRPGCRPTAARVNRDKPCFRHIPIVYALVSGGGHG